mgnify:CR=1 FL=1|tara:strand:+ start:7175 stop:8098 length:924 start_codon:yes stop_codon:yes gene_type:complete
MRINKLDGILLGLALLAPLVAYPTFLMKVLCFALFACAFNLLLGFAGLLSFGHAVFLGTGAYITGYLLTQFSLTPELGILGGTVASAVLGLVYGKLAVRREGIYFAMVTLALAQLMFFLFLQAPFTGGEDGLQGIPRGQLLGLIDLSDNLTLYYFVLAIFIAGFALVRRTVRSPFGQVLKAIRENEPRAISLGYRVEQFKLVAFVISAALAGLAGSTKALVFQLASLNDAHWFMSGEVVLITLLGGVGTLWGPVLGAGALLALENLLASGPLANYTHVVMGIVFILCVLVFRQGLVGELQKLIRKSF